MHNLSGNSLIEMRGLGTHVSRGTIAAHGMTLTIREGGISTLIRLSGCGKTTLFTMIAGPRSRSARTGTVNDHPPGVGTYAIFVTNSIFEFVNLSHRVVMAARPGLTVNQFDLPSDDPAPGGSGNPATKRNGDALPARQWGKYWIIPVPETEAMVALTPPRAFRVRRNLHTVVPVLASPVALCFRELHVRYNEKPHDLIQPPCLVATTLARDFVAIEGSMRFIMNLAMAALGLAIVGGILVGIFFALSLTVEGSIFPFGVVLQATPVVGIDFPVFIQASSNTLAAPLTCACIAAFIPNLASTVIGLRCADHDPRGLFARNGTIPGQGLRRLPVAQAHPDFLAAREVAGALSLIGAAVAECVAGAAGQDAGFVLRKLESSFRDGTPRMIAVLLMVPLLSIVIGLISIRQSRPVLVHRHATELKTEVRRE
ncbi:MAG: hypothetical protein OXF56_19395 [Rhodobacteraceae bacterium]|nr:hypothetical protein [Paracoccaceae bacterium]